MKRPSLALLLLAVLLPACRTAGPTAPPGPSVPLPDLLRAYEGAARVLPHRGDESGITLAAGQRLAGTCDIAVRVLRVAFEKGEARFALETVGQPKVGERGVTCRRIEPLIQLVLTGFPSGPVSPEVTARIDAVLLTPEAYLQAGGTAFDRPPGQAPAEAASQLTDASDGERKIARQVVAWPRRLMSVDPARKASKGRPHYERLVDVEAVVGADGRLYRPLVKSSLDPDLEHLVVGALPFWRFEPARRADGPVAARVALQLVLRIY